MAARVFSASDLSSSSSTSTRAPSRKLPASQGSKHTHTHTKTHFLPKQGNLQGYLYTPDTPLPSSPVPTPPPSPFHLPRTTRYHIESLSRASSFVYKQIYFLVRPLGGAAIAAPRSKTKQGCSILGHLLLLFLKQFDVKAFI